MYNPKFTYTSRIRDLLEQIERSRAVVNLHPLPASVEQNLRRMARIRQARFSTAIEGNTLSTEEVSKVVGGKSDRSGSRAEQEVRNYWNALNFLARAKWLKIRISEEFIKRLHAVIDTRGPGRRDRASKYRGAMPIGVPFVVSDSITGDVAYRPPMWDEVPKLMAEFVSWLNSQECAKLPPPVRAAIGVYQFLTIHPFRDGNGRTGRALATYILNLSGYDLKGLYSFEDHYFADLQGYYDNLQMNLPADYYFSPGRGNPVDLAPWITYFLEVMARAFGLVERQARTEFRLIQSSMHPVAKTPKERCLVTHLLQHPHPITQKEIADIFGVAATQIGTWIDTWLSSGLLERVGTAKRSRKYRLGSAYRQLSLTDFGVAE